MFDFIVFHDALRFLIIALHLKCGVKTMGQSSYVFLLVISASFKQKNGEQEEHHFLCSSKWFPRLQSELEAQRGWVIGVFPWKRQSVWLIFYQSIQNRLPCWIVGHLPIEISRITKFIIDRGAQVTIKTRGRHYRRSPLIQGGLEVPCEIKITMLGSIINHHLLVRYESLLKGLNIEPIGIGTFLLIRNEHEM